MQFDRCAIGTAHRTVHNMALRLMLCTLNQKVNVKSNSTIFRLSVNLMYNDYISNVIGID